MIEMRKARADEQARQMELWHQVFGDSAEYIAGFYADCGALGDTLVLLEGGKLVTMLTALPLILRDGPTGETRRAAYVYALATDPAVRGKGYARELLNYADFFLREQGYDCVCLVPAEPSLRRFFEAAGYLNFCATRKTELPHASIAPPAVDDTIAPAAPDDYNRIRRALLKDGPYFDYSDALIAHQKNNGTRSGADCYLLTVGGKQAVAAVEWYTEDAVLVKELLAPETHIMQAVSLLKAHLPAAHYHVRTTGAVFVGSLPGSYLQTIAMAKWHAPAPPWSQGAYFGLAFD